MEGAREPVLLLQGPTGSGKSYLLRAAARLTTLRTVLVAARRNEESWPLSGLGALCTAIAGEPIALTRREPSSLDGAAIHEIAMNVLDALHGHDVGPTLALIDDVDHFDPQSRAVLGYLSARLGGSGLHILGTVTSLSPDDPLLGLPVYEIPRLDNDEALELVQDAPVPVERGTAWILIRQAGGNPGVLRAALDALSEEERLGTESLQLPLPPLGPATEIAAAATADLDDDARALLTLLAAAPLTPRALANESQEEGDALADLFQLRLVEEADTYVRVRSPLVRSAVYGALSGRDRRELHAGLRERLRDVDDALAVWHASFAEPQERWAPALLSAGTRLLRSGFRRAAVELAERGMASRGNGSVSVRALDFATALVDAGLLALAGRYVARLDRESLPPSEHLPFALARVLSDIARNGRIADSEVDAAVAVQADVAPDAAVSLWSVSALLHALLDDVSGARAAVEGASGLVDRVGPTARSLYFGVSELIDAAAGAPCGPLDSRSLRELSRRSTEELIARGRARSLCGDTVGAARIFSLVIDLPGPVEPLWRRLATLLVADNALRGSDFGTASATVRDLRTGPPPELLRPFFDLVGHLVDLIVDDVPGTAERIGEWVHTAAPPLALAIGRLALGELALFDGDPETALRQLRHADSLASHVASPSLLRHHPALIEALMAVEDMPAARAVLDRLETAARSMPHPWTRRAVIVGRALVARGEESRRLFDAAADAASGAQPDYADAMLLVRRARRLRALGAAETAVAALRARTILERIGARGWVRLADDSVAPASPSAAHALLDRLTPEERLVADLVLQGLQNKEIAARLFISLRTVELRLTHVYRKTGARSRAHLVSMLV